MIERIEEVISRLEHDAAIILDLLEHLVRRHFPDEYK
jgi:hypothetical protein